MKKRPARFIRTLAFVIALGIGFQTSNAMASTYSFTGSLAQARDGHSAVLLPNGKVLVAGGSDDQKGLTSAELYDPATGSWSATGSALTPFVVAPAILLPNGKVLVIGYLGAQAVQLYDPATGNWTATGTLHFPRSQCTATLLTNGKVLVAGGSDINGTSLASAEVYDPATGAWTLTDPLSAHRASPTATLLPNGRVLVAGGYSFVPPATSDDGVVASAEIYNPSTGHWTPTGDLGTARCNHTATLLNDGRVLIVGGNDFNDLASAEIWDPATGDWSETGSLAGPRNYHTATLLPSGRVAVMGGRSPSGYLTKTEVYDPSTGVWSPDGDLLQARELHTATLLPNGKVLIVGGEYAGPLASAELYDPAATTTAQLQNIATRLNVLGADKVLIGGFIITGNAPKKIMLRAIGPSLTGLGVAGALPDPVLELHKADGSVVTNDNWKIDDQTGQSQEATIAATGIPPSNELESALVQTLAPGNYSAIVSGKGGGVGIGLVEAYDLDSAAPAKLANISTRGLVDTGQNVMIGGFILGPGSFADNQIVVRAIGPSLNIPGKLINPTLEVHNENGDKIASNDDWRTDDATGHSQEFEIRNTTLAPSHDWESALLLALAPGHYTAVVAGKNGSTGIGLVEVYSLR